MSIIVEIHLDTINLQYISRYLGYDEIHPPSPLAASLVESESQWLLENITPRGVYDIFPCGLPDNRTIAVGGKTFHSRVLRMHLEGSIYAAALAATMGDEVDKRISNLMEHGQAAQSYILSSVASAAIDCVADAIETKIREAVSKCESDGISAFAASDCDQSWKTTQRFSPGYADFIIENQAAMFDLLKPGCIGLRLTPSSLMLPLKSITALVGIGPDVKTEGYPCDICDRCNITECRYFDG